MSAGASFFGGGRSVAIAKAHRCRGNVKGNALQHAKARAKLDEARRLKAQGFTVSEAAEALGYNRKAFNAMLLKQTGSGAWEDLEC